MLDTSSENAVNAIAQLRYESECGKISEKVSAHDVTSPIAVFMQQKVTVRASTIMPVLPR